MIAFQQFVRRPVSVMPAYAPRVLPDEDLQKIYAYLGSIEEPPKLEEIPELR